MPAYVGRSLTKFPLSECQERKEEDSHEENRAECTSTSAGILVLVSLGLIAIAWLGNYCNGGECTRQNYGKYFFSTTVSNLAMRPAIKTNWQQIQYFKKCESMLESQAESEHGVYSRTTRAFRLRTALATPAEVRVGRIACSRDEEIEMN